MNDDWAERRHLAMLVDYYEWTMINGYLAQGVGDRVAVFDMFFRRIPDDGGYAVMAGLEQLVRYLEDLHFSESDIRFLQGKGLFRDEFLQWLRDFQFTCDVYAIPEGTPVFPNEPILVVKGPVMQAQFIETMVLLSVNHQSLIATKANRIVRAAGGRRVMEFGSRRAQGYDGALLGARAAYIGGCDGTSCTLADKMFGIPSLGTMAHSWVQLFDDELEAFRAYAKTYPDTCTLLVDTYDVLQSGVPNAIQVFEEEVVSRGFRPRGIRIDSGDIAWLSREARKLLDAAGFEDCAIVASNALDEHLILNLLQQGACIDVFGVGERLITSRSEPVFGGVYKLTAVEENGRLSPRIKRSENVGKITVPGFKQVWRFFDKNSGKAIADVVAGWDEDMPDGSPYEIFDPEHTWKRKTLMDYDVVALLEPVFLKGERVGASPSLLDIRAHCASQVGRLWDAVLRFENPHRYHVDLSQEVWDTRAKLLKKSTS